MDFPCPLCDCMQPVRQNRRQKPYFRCDKCGVLMFVNNPLGIRLIENDCASPRKKQLDSPTVASLFHP
jgi:hypothetical protein